MLVRKTLFRERSTNEERDWLPIQEVVEMVFEQKILWREERCE